MVELVSSHMLLDWNCTFKQCILWCGKLKQFLSFSSWDIRECRIWPFCRLVVPGSHCLPHVYKKGKLFGSLLWRFQLRFNSPRSTVSRVLNLNEQRTSDRTTERTRTAEYRKWKSPTSRIHKNRLESTESPGRHSSRCSGPYEPTVWT